MNRWKTYCGQCGKGFWFWQNTFKHTRKEHFWTPRTQEERERLIKGENKTGHNGAEHTPCCNDWGCYGCEDCDCPDCLEGENK